LNADPENKKYAVKPDCMATAMMKFMTKENPVKLRCKGSNKNFKLLAPPPLLLPHKILSNTKCTISLPLPRI
jgi:hypothetical protein